MCLVVTSAAISADCLWKDLIHPRIRNYMTNCEDETLKHWCSPLVLAVQLVRSHLIEQLNIGLLFSVQEWGLFANQSVPLATRLGLTPPSTPKPLFFALMLLLPSITPSPSHHWFLHHCFLHHCFLFLRHCIIVSLSLRYMSRKTVITKKNTYRVLCWKNVISN